MSHAPRPTPQRIRRSHHAPRPRSRPQPRPRLPTTDNRLPIADCR
ncbi:hypothetical protein FM103_12020 [Corynebacterium xerosis]|nr:hypothetical protein FM103_12020 [Corynebacterium xerosis]